MLTYQEPGINLDQFLDLLPKAHRYTDYVVACCPFHGDNHPSFFIYKDRYFCRACGKYGRTSKLLKHLEGKTTIISNNIDYEFGNPFSNWLKKQSLKEIILTSRKKPSNYLKQRGIPYHIQKQLSIGLKENWVIIPIIDSNQHLQGALARAGEGNNSPTRYFIPKGQSTELLYSPSWKRVNSSQIVYLTFGVIDSISLYLLGLPVISTTGGKHLKPESLFHIRKEIHIIPDKGEEKEAIHLAKMLGWRGKVKMLNYPENCKDANDYFCVSRESLLSEFGT